MNTTYPSPNAVIPVHPLCTIFPPMSDEEKVELRESIEKNGQREPVVLFEGQILDGRNRYEVCRELGIEPKYRYFDPRIDKTPLEFVTDKNLRRRHLSQSQKALIAAEMLPMFEEAARARQSRPKAPVMEDEPVRPVRSVDVAAAAAGVSAGNVSAAKKIIAENPEGAERIRQGKTTIHAEMKNTKPDPEIEKAITKIGKVCGKGLENAVREGVRLKGKREILAFVNLGDEKMKQIAGLVAEGWKVDKAKRFRFSKITGKSTLDELLVAAAANGGKLEVEIKGKRITVG